MIFALKEIFVIAKILEISNRKEDKNILMQRMKNNLSKLLNDQLKIKYKKFEKM